MSDQHQGTREQREIARIKAIGNTTERRNEGTGRVRFEIFANRLREDFEQSQARLFAGSTSTSFPRPCTPVNARDPPCTSNAFATQTMRLLYDRSLRQWMMIVYYRFELHLGKWDTIHFAPVTL